MKVIFEAQDEIEARLIMSSHDMFCVLWDLREELRRDRKYNDDKHNGQFWGEKLQDMLESKNINLDHGAQ